jgi:hypothetical protein
VPTPENVNEYDPGEVRAAPRSPNGESPPVPPSRPQAAGSHRVNVCGLPVLFCQVTVPPDGVVTALGRKQYVPPAIE